MNADQELMMLLFQAGATNVELRWSPGLEVRIQLPAMDWDIRARCLEEVKRYVNADEHCVSAGVRFTFPEPVDFTEAIVHKDGLPVSAV